MVVQGDTLLARDTVDKLRELVTELQLVKGTGGVLSLFSARTPPENGQLPAPLFPAALPEGAAYDALIQKALNNEIIRGELLSEDGKLALIVIAFKPSVTDGNAEAEAIGEIRRSSAEMLEGTGLNAELTGVPGCGSKSATPWSATRYFIIASASRRAPDRHCVLPADFLYDHRGWTAADRDPFGAGHARMARFSAQHLPQRDDAAHHGH